MENIEYPIEKMNEIEENIKEVMEKLRKVRPEEAKITREKWGYDSNSNISVRTWGDRFRLFLHSALKEVQFAIRDYAEMKEREEG